MACLSTDSGDSGFATPAAIMVSLVVGLGAATLVEASLAELKLARADFAKAQIEAALEGAQQLAAVSLLSGVDQGTVDMAQSVGGRQVQVLAEPEGLKASVAAVIGMNNDVFAPLGVGDPQALKDRLKTLTIAQAIGPELEQADAAPQWRACARLLISPFGLSEVLRSLPAASGSLDVAAPTAGQIWRVRAQDPSGWVDDRVMRLTGDNVHPAATLGRRFWKQDREGSKCQTVFESAG
jgi:hypothetical protein